MFLESILPDTGLYCVAKLKPTGKFQHFFYATIEEAETQIQLLDNQGFNVYIAQATFNAERVRAAEAHNAALPRGLSKEEWKARAMGLRTQANAILLKNFFLDIDCGEKWPLKNQKEGAAALNDFIAITGLPFPTVVSSGNGLYAHWILENAISSDIWITIARILKSVVAAVSPALGGDASRTSDSASVLRPPGTTNRKPGHAEKPVVILKSSKPVDFDSFVATLKTAANKVKVPTTALVPPKAASDVNSEFYAGLENQSVPSDAEKIADKCSQMGAMRRSGGDVPEPMWYACIGILAHCERGEEIVHDWSSGYAGYNYGETSSKFKQWISTGYGPTTCAKFGDVDPSGCIGCRHNGKIKSPIVLGRPEPKVLESLTADIDCPVPDGFRRGEDGLYYEDDGRWLKFYDQDLYLHQLAYDESIGYEVMTIRHKLPHEGELECTIRSSIVNDLKALMTTLSDNHIKVVGMKEKKLMGAYLESYQVRMQRAKKMGRLLCQMGWKEERNGKPIFVLGRNIFHTDGSVDEAAFARNVPSAAEAFKTTGELAPWVADTDIFGRPGMEPLAFAFLAGGFGAPLMKFTGYDGALISMVGESGVGKTLVLRKINSIWGYHNDLMMLQDDTKNALVSRLGVYGNLPLTVDEITNMEGMELSSLVYRITQGRDKVRLTRNAEEKKNLNRWNTVAVSTSNESIIDKLSSLKHDASAEINRVFEYHVSEQECFSGDTTRNMFRTLHENYGLAGVEYAQWITVNHDTIRDKLDKVREKIDNSVGAHGDERFWTAIAAVAWLGGLVARHLGLIRFDVEPVMQWACHTINRMRADKRDLAGDAVGILGQFFDEFAMNRLLVKGETKGPQLTTIIEAPRGSLYWRYEVDTKKAFISRSVIKKSIAKRYGSYTAVKKELIGLGILTDPNKRKVLGSGTLYSGAQQVCWEIDMSNRNLGESGMYIRQVADALAKQVGEGK